LQGIQSYSLLSSGKEPGGYINHFLKGEVMKIKSILVLAAAVLVVLGLSGSTLIADVNEELISHWRLDEGGGAIAYDSAGTNDGAIYGAAWTTGILENALSFDGIDYVQVPNHNSLCLEDAFTLSAFIKIDDSWNLYGRIICKRHDVSGNGYALLLYDEKRPRLLTEMNEMCASDVSISMDRWTHVAATYDWANRRTALYI
jgi:hypothetical protein